MIGLLSSKIHKKLKTKPTETNEIIMVFDNAQ